MLTAARALLLTTSLLVAASASAEPAPPAPPAASKAPATGAVKAAPAAVPKAAAPAAAVRRDPRGVKGIGPFMEAVNKGDSALLARDFEAAITAYREAIGKEPQNALGHYRMGAAQLAKGDLHEADEALLSGLRFVTGTDLALKAKLQFALADLRERQKSYDEALSKWSDYQTTTADEKNPVGFPASALERKKVVETWKKLSADSLEVKARIDKGLAAADEAVRKSSK